MTAFIQQEALEKAKEIKIKADEEFAIEKSKLVRQETAAIDAAYEKKFKQASMSQQITRSTVANKSRLRVLTARQELLDDLFDEARKKLTSVTKDKKKYQSLLEKLILESLYPMNESKVSVQAKKADYDLVKKAFDGAAKEYKSKTSKDVKIELDEEEPLPADSYVFQHLPCPFLTNSAVLEVSLCWEPGERLPSTTPSTNACACLRPKLSPTSEPFFLARMKTGNSTTKLPSLSLLVCWEGLFCVLYIYSIPRYSACFADKLQ